MCIMVKMCIMVNLFMPVLAPLCCCCGVFCGSFVRQLFDPDAGSPLFSVIASWPIFAAAFLFGFAWAIGSAILPVRLKIMPVLVVCVSAFVCCSIFCLSPQF